MSIVTYYDLDTPVFEIDFLRYLFASGEQGSLWGPLPYYSDAAGTVEADWGDPVGNIPDAYGDEPGWTQVTSTARPILRNSPPRLEFDGTDDQVTTTLPAISGGTIVLAGVNGIWIDELDFAGGEFSVGPDTYTGGPAGLMSILGDILVEGGFVIDRALTPEEIAQVKGYYVARGSAGLIELGPEMLVNTGWPFTDTIGWEAVGGDVLDVESGMLVVTRTDVTSAAQTSVPELQGHPCLFEIEYSGGSAGATARDGPGDIFFSFSSPGIMRSIRTFSTGTLRLQIAGVEAGTTNMWSGVSVRRLIMPGETP